MNIRGKPWRTIWPGTDGQSVEIIDQTRLPHELRTVRLTTLAEAAHAIRATLVRGADLKQALALTSAAETLAALYWRTLCAGEPTLLSDTEMIRIVEKFRAFGYGPVAANRSAL